jgi:NodT family efflux transporter outer membrane factor (OMF) lipoprotein
MNSLMRSTYLLLTTSLLLTACAVTRVEPPKQIAPAAQFKEVGHWQLAAAHTNTAVPDDWWTLFNDPTLDQLQRRLLVGNQNIKAVAAQVSSARAVYEASRGAMAPTVSAGLTTTRSDNPTSNTQPNTQNPSNNLFLSSTASWEIDLWGRLSLASLSAQNTLQASSDDVAAAQALLVQTYFSLRTLDAQAALVQRTIQGHQHSLNLTQTRYDNGITGRIDILQAQTQLKNTQAQLTDTLAQRAQLEHAIAVLLGLEPAAFSFVTSPLECSSTQPTLPAVPLMLPATLLERRPDIAAAQRRVAAAYAKIGVADAAFFPDLTLSANVGYRGSSLAKLVSAPNLLWSLGASLTEAVFDGSQRKLASAQARAAAEQTTSTYRQIVLTALQEVEDNLVLAHQLQQEVQLRSEAMQAAQSAVKITLIQYRAGLTSYLDVVAAQTTALTAESAWLTAYSHQLIAVNQLLKNIAGRPDSCGLCTP